MSDENKKLSPNLDEQSTKVLNLTVLQRMDPFINQILFTAAHSRKDVEGSLFVVKRSSQPRFQFIVMNRRNTDNLVENLLDFEYELKKPYLLYRNAAQDVNGIWFYDPDECEQVANLFNSGKEVNNLLKPSTYFSSTSSSSYPMLQPFPPPNPSLSLAPISNSNPSKPVITRDKVRDALVSLFQDDQFIDMMFQALLKVNHS
ncbi:unnamed protein product [Lupinus luteus]|uniref:mRNA-decapping enzyme-like protein n=1 Tax=Lupinus luteus TaxID=3873 RepID=A0AAV1WMI9_LUPLU